MIEQFEQQLMPLADVLDSVLASALDRTRQASTWSAYELRTSHEDQLQLSNDRDACYDRPSSGWAYAAWYHGRRTTSAVELLAPSLLDGSDPVTIVDLGSGTGSTLWAVVAIIAAAKRAQIDVPRIDVHAVDSSVPMHETAQALWKSVASNRDLGPAAACFKKRFHLGTWTNLRDHRPQPGQRCILVSSYLFDSSDKAQSDHIGALFADAADQVGATDVLLATGARKIGVLEATRRHLSDNGWESSVHGRPVVTVDWDGRMASVAKVRRAVLEVVPGRAHALSAAPVWRSDREAPRLESFRRQPRGGQLLPPTRWRRLDLDASQERAANPTGGLTAIVGAAGSGKSVVLVERMVRTVLNRRDRHEPANALVTTFNKKLVSQLATWLHERLSDDPDIPEWDWRESGETHTFTGPAILGSPTITMAHWDKVPYLVPAIRTALAGKGATGDLATPDANAIERELRRLGRVPDELSWSERRVIEPAFVEAELHRVIYGLGRWMSRDAYLTEPRTGRLRQIGSRQRELVWSVAMQGRLASWSHRRMVVLDAARAASRLNPAPYSHLFLDECQDMTPADFELATLLVNDPARIVVTGDETQSLRLGTAYRRPRRLAIPEPYRRSSQPAARQWTEHELSGSYRLPVRVCECVLPLADRIMGSRAEREDDHDVVLPRPQKAAVLGLRPIVVAAVTAERTLPEVLKAYRRLVDAEPYRQRIVTTAEADLDFDLRESVPRRADWTVERRSMLEIKGLERPCVIWPTHAPLPTDESELEWIYTILTRSTAITIIMVDSQRCSPPAREALGLLARNRLLFWDERAEAAFNEAVAASTEGPDLRVRRTDHQRPEEPPPIPSTSSEESWIYDKPSTLTQAQVADMARDHPGLLDSYPRSFSFWTAHEDAHLARLHGHELVISQIAGLHRREPGSIRKRLEQLGLSRRIL